MALIVLASGDVSVLQGQLWSPPAVTVLALTCLGGLGMSYFSFALRAVISATSFSVIGNVCKVLTILVNLLIWDNHASAPLRCRAVKNVGELLIAPASCSPPRQPAELHGIQACAPVHVSRER